MSNNTIKIHICNKMKNTHIHVDENTYMLGCTCFKFTKFIPRNNIHWNIAPNKKKTFIGI